MKTSVTVVADGHLRLQVGEASVEISATRTGISVGVFAGGNSKPTMSFDHAYEQKPALPVAPIPARPVFIPAQAPQRAPAAKAKPKRRRSPHKRHIIGVTAPGDSNPVRYWTRLLLSSRYPASASRLVAFLEKVNALTGMNVARLPGESLGDAHKRGLRELQGWWEVYAHANKMDPNFGWSHTKGSRWVNTRRSERPEA